MTNQQIADRIIELHFLYQRYAGQYGMLEYWAKNIPGTIELPTRYNWHIEEFSAEYFNMWEETFTKQLAILDVLFNKLTSVRLNEFYNSGNA